MLALWMMYDSGIVNIEKVRLQNTADSAAYSSAVVVARDMNFIAYTNRAMVANQVSMGQMVGMASLAHHQSAYASQIGLLAGFIPSAKVIEPIATVVAKGIDALATIMANSIVPQNEFVITGLSEAQAAFHLTASIAAERMSTDVTLANDADVKQLSLFGVAQLHEQIADLIGTIQNLRPNAASLPSGADDDPKKRFSEFQNIVVQSEDRFTANRSYVWGAPFSATYGKPIPISGLGLVDAYESRKYGGNEFQSGTDSSGKLKWEWSAMDDVSVWADICSGKPVTCKWQEKIPLGYGVANALNRDQATKVYNNYLTQKANVAQWGNGAWKNPLSANLAYQSQLPDGKKTNVAGTFEGGLRPFYDFKTDDNVDQGPSVLILVTKGEQYIQTQKTMATTVPNYSIAPDLDIEEDGGLPKGKMAAMAKAQPYFYRPNEACSGSAPCWQRQARPSWITTGNNDSPPKFEHGNLYNPFWQTRLVDTTDQEKAAALAVLAVY